MHERGAVAVEFALIVPVVLVLLFGVIGFGIVFAQQLALGNSARQAARFGAVANTCQEIVEEARAASSTIGIKTSEVVVEVSRRNAAGAVTLVPNCGSADWSRLDPPCKGSSAGDSLYVATKFKSSLVIPFSPVDQPSFELKSSGEFRCEHS
jgi:hypothetical protein